MKIKDVTREMDFFVNDDEYLPIIKCKCGKRFDDWDFIIDIYKDSENKCPKCNSRFYFENRIKIYEVIKEID